MDIDLLIERLLDIKKQGASRVYLGNAGRLTYIRRIQVDRDKDGDAVLFGE